MLTSLAAIASSVGWATACSTSTAPNPPPPPPPGAALATEIVASGLERPVYLTSPPGDPRLFIVQQTGRIRIVDAAGGLLAAPFLDLEGGVDGSSEGGLLNLAFHPDYATNGFAYVNYTNTAGNTVVARYSVSADPNRLDPASAKQILTVEQPFANHNGGQLQFGADGMLYVFLGDGGSGGDPFGHGQDLSTLLGSILRLDVDGGDPYAIPSDNPFVGTPGARGEIWAYGLRNPWRGSFDAASGTLYVADVGQAAREEVNAVPAGAGGVNYGWNVMEGSTCFGGGGCSTQGLTLPVSEYDHGEGCSVTGGYVYRGSALPSLRGHYFYSDFCAGFLRSFRLVGALATDTREWNVGILGAVSSFGVDRSGELYVLDLSGTVRRLIPAG